jgi:hypothetical protein
MSGKVPLPIEPKPIMTIGPVMRAWRRQCGMIVFLLSAVGDAGPPARRSKSKRSPARQ